MKICKDNLCIAISGKSGCGNTSAGKALSQLLDIPLINYTLRNLAVDNNMSLEDIRKLASVDPKWDYMIDERQKKLSKESACIVGSRLAVWVIDHADIKIYLYADEQTRVNRILKREGGNVEEQHKKTHDRDIKDVQRYKELYNIDINQYKEVVDLIIDTNNKTQKQVLQNILQELEKRALITR